MGIKASLVYVTSRINNTLSPVSMTKPSLLIKRRQTSRLGLITIRSITPPSPLYKSGVSYSVSVTLTGSMIATNERPPNQGFVMVLTQVPLYPL